MYSFGPPESHSTLKVKRKSVLDWRTDLPLFLLEEHGVHAAVLVEQTNSSQVHGLFDGPSETASHETHSLPLCQVRLTSEPR